MKKILAIIVLLCALGVSASAADMTFTPEGEGKWIYCNNPEAIRNQDLMNSDDNPPSYIMNNENLEPDLYDFLICHINYTDSNGGYGAGYEIEVDVELTAVEDSEITINKAFFEAVEDESFIFSDGTWSKETNKFGCINGLASMLGVNLSQLNGAWLYEAKPYEPVTVELKKGETIWLSDYMDDYTSIGYHKPSQILGELSLNYGKMNFNVAAFKTGDELKDRSSFDPNAKFGKYSYTRTEKGIADSLPKVNVDLEYTIDNTYKDGEYIKNKVFNQLSSSFGKIRNIKIENLSFKYKNSTEYVLKNINLTICENDHLAIVGKNGSGKSTLLKILLGLYDDYEGNVYINGVEIRNIEKEKLYSQISILFQDYTKYELSVRENICCSCIEYQQENSRIYQALEKIDANKKIYNLDKRLGCYFENGIQLSGGEWLKIGLARIFFKEANLILLDEPNAALDPISEQEVLKKIKKETEGKISIIITHKFVNIPLYANRIVVMNQGKIEGDGKHEELIRKCNMYDELYNASLKEL